jgi:L-lysine 6-transaminase
VQNVKAKDVFKTLKKSILVDGFHVAIDLQKSKGNYIVDAVTGEKYLDCYSYFASLPAGHNHPKLKTKQVLKDLQTAALANPANADIYSKELAGSVDTFRRLAMPKGFTNLFFIAGGGLAVENALKVAFDWKVRKNFKKGIKKEKGTKIIHFKEAFHGRTGYTMSLTNTDPNKIKYFPKFKWPRVTNPKLSFPLTEKVLKEVIKNEKKSLKEIKDAIAKNPDDIAGLIIEPIQGEGGDNHFRPEFLQAVQKICNKNDILFICDEVQSGMGATGKMWAFEHFGITPDLICFGKKAQVCGVIGGPRVHEIDDNVFKVSSRINSTWGGNLVDFVRGARYLEIIKEDKLVQNAAQVGKYFLSQLNKHIYDGKKVTNVRGRGLFVAFDLKDHDTRNKLVSDCWANGLAALTCGGISIRFRPCLTFTKKDVDKVIKILKKCL